jgi:predicted MPP superfamily phosphohydrolase
MDSFGLPILVNQFVQIERGAHVIAVGGLQDWEFGIPNIQLSTPTDPEIPTIVMVHEPDFADPLNSATYNRRIDLLLSGHTHGGQVILPGLKPLNLPPNGQHYPHGHYSLPNLQLYVNRGLGTVGVPFRFNCPPELTLATLRPTPTATS